MTPAGRLRAAADTIDHTAVNATDEHWQAGTSWAGALTIMGSVGQPVAVVAADTGGASDGAKADAAHIAMWDPPTTRHAATLLRTIAGYVDEADRLGLSVVEGDLTASALALADAILTAADVPA